MAAKNFTILGIDTSCDDTCAALLEIKNQASERSEGGKEGKSLFGHPKFKILSNVVSSQVKLHAKYGGVYPSLAKREHQKNLPVVFRKATKNIDTSKIDLIGVTNGPGLEPCLWQGINFAKDLAEKFKKSLISVNHLEAHILNNWLEYGNIPMPAVCLVVSGGHTQLIFMKGVGKYRLIGETRDDAAGECFDKAARILGIGYPGGPAVALEAAKFKGGQPLIKLPRPMIHQKNYDFSFSGLKTAVLYKVRGEKYDKAGMCAEIQQAIIDVLIYKTIKAAKNCKAKSIILGGGVAANNELRKQFKEKIKKEMPSVKYYVPDKKFCTDNAVMISITAFFHRYNSSKTESRRSGTKVIKAVADLQV